jgi:hypothetical protein
MNSDRYRDMAAACAKDMEQLRDPEERMKLLSVAQAYLRLAEHVGVRRDCATAHPEIDS